MGYTDSCMWLAADLSVAISVNGGGGIVELAWGRIKLAITKRLFHQHQRDNKIGLQYISGNGSTALSLSLSLSGEDSTAFYSGEGSTALSLSLLELERG